MPDIASPLFTSKRSTVGIDVDVPDSLAGEIAVIVKSSDEASVNNGSTSLLVMLFEAVIVPPVPSSYKLYEIVADPDACFILSVPVLLYKIQFVAVTVPDST